jgi:predicted XRE-type DNA-binding protein
MVGTETLHEFVLALLFAFGGAADPADRRPDRRRTASVADLLRGKCGPLWPASGAAHLLQCFEAVRAQRLADIRKAHGQRQSDIAALMGVWQARVSKLESGDLSHTEIGTLQSYVAALGGQLRITAQFDEHRVDLDA